MALSGWLVLMVACLIYIALGLWAVSQIFPHDRVTTNGSAQDQQKEGTRQ